MFTSEAPTHGDKDLQRKMHAACSCATTESDSSHAPDLMRSGTQAVWAVRTKQRRHGRAASTPTSWRISWPPLARMAMLNLSCFWAATIIFLQQHQMMACVATAEKLAVAPYHHVHHHHHFICCLSSSLASEHGHLHSVKPQARPITGKAEAVICNRRLPLACRASLCICKR